MVLGSSQKILGRIDISVMLKLLIQGQIITVKVIFIHSVKFIVIYKVYTKIYNQSMQLYIAWTHTHLRVLEQRDSTKSLSPERTE